MKKNGLMMRVLSALTALAAFCTMVMPASADVIAGAAQSEAAVKTTHTADEAIAWCKSQLGKSLDYDGNGVWCVDLINYYYKYLDVTPVLGNGADFATNKLPAGFVRTKGAVPKKGDILVYTGSINGWGHVAISADDGGNTSYHQCWSSDKRCVEYVKTKYNNTNTITYWGCIHPDFADSKKFEPAAINDTASFRNCGNNEYLSVAGNADVQKAAIITGAKSAAMNFTISQVNGFTDSHKIKPVRFSRIVNPLADVVKAGVKVTLYDDQGSKNDNSQWFVFESLGDKKYVIHNKQNMDCVLSVSNHKVVMATYEANNQNQNQIWYLDAPISVQNVQSDQQTAYTYGIDISRFNDVSDFGKVSSALSFVIMRSNTGSYSDLNACYEDSMFKTYIKAASKTNLALGVYGWCPAATKTDMVNYTNTMLKTIAGYDYKMGVWLDIEAVDAQYALGKAQLTQIILAGLDNIATAGYSAGVYASANDWKHYIDADLIREKGYLTWVAAWPGGDDPTSKYDYSDYNVWQYSNTGKVNGVNGNVDLDICYTNFTKNDDSDLEYKENEAHQGDISEEVVYIIDPSNGKYICAEQLKIAGNIGLKDTPDDSCKWIREEDYENGGCLFRAYQDHSLVLNPYCDTGTFNGGNAVNVVLYPECGDINQRWKTSAIFDDNRNAAEYAIENRYEAGGLEASGNNVVLDDTGNNVWIIRAVEEEEPETSDVVSGIEKILSDVAEAAVKAAEAALLAGDANCDGNITVSDAILLARVIAEDGTVQISEEGLKNTEFLDATAGIDTTDLNLLMTMIVS